MNAGYVVIEGNFIYLNIDLLNLYTVWGACGRRGLGKVEGCTFKKAKSSIILRNRKSEDKTEMKKLRNRSISMLFRNVKTNMRRSN